MSAPPLATTSHEVGDGYHRTFWLDAWCSNDDLSTMFAALFSHARVKDISVHGLLELSSLENLMSRISLTNTPVCATALLQMNPDGLK
jgi:hypothetical protein